MDPKVIRGPESLVVLSDRI